MEEIESKRKELGEFVFPFPKAIVRMNNDALFLPYEVWEYILSWLPDIHLVKAMNVCKNWNALVRSSDFLRQVVANKSMVDAFLYFGKMRLNARVMGLIKSELENYDRESRSAFISGLPARIDDSKLLYEIYYSFRVPCVSSFMDLPLFCFEFAYLARLYDPEIFWRPPHRDALLLSYFDFKTVVRPVMLSFLSGPFPHYFAPALLTQYIIPAFNGTRSLNYQEIEMIKSIAPYCGMKFSPFFQSLLYAIYLIDGRVNLQMPTIKRLHNLMCHVLGFNWISLSTMHSDYRMYKSQFEEKHISPKVIGMAASMWGLDMNRVYAGFRNHGYGEHLLGDWKSLLDTDLTVLNLLQTFVSDISTGHCKIEMINAIPYFFVPKLSQNCRTRELLAAIKRPAYEFVEDIDGNRPFKRIKVEEVESDQDIPIELDQPSSSSIEKDYSEDDEFHIDRQTYWTDETWWANMSRDEGSDLL